MTILLIITFLSKIDSFSYHNEPKIVQILLKYLYQHFVPFGF